jgi:hypothetical protein
LIHIVIFPPRNENKLQKKESPFLAREKRRSERGKRAESALCPHCGKEFRYLAQHIKLAHLGGVKFAPATCHICKKVYTQKSHLKQHVRAVHEQVPRQGCQLVLRIRSQIWESKNGPYIAEAL